MYDKQKHNRAVKIADKIKSKIGDGLIKNTDENFENIIRHGKSYSLAELGSLNSHFKKEYMDTILKLDEDVDQGVQASE